MMNKEQKKNYIEEMTNKFENSKAVMVTHYQGLTMTQLDELRAKMREHGIIFRITKNRITKLALEKTKCKELSNLFTGPTAVALSEDAITSAKNLQPSSEEGFGTYRVICKLQWDFSNKSIDPCAGSVQIQECENLSVLPRKYFPIFMESFDVNDLEKNIKLLYNKLHDIRENPAISY